MTTIVPILIAGFLAGWAVLSLIGGERTRRAWEIEAAKAASVLPPKPASAEAHLLNRPVSGKPAGASGKAASAPGAKPPAGASKTQSSPRKS